MRALARVGLGLSLLLVAAASWAGAPSRRPTVAHLASLSPSSPLADRRGRVPVTVRLQEGESASSLGLLEVAKGIGARWVKTDDLGAFVEGARDRNPWVSPPLHLLLDQSGQWTRSIAARRDLGLTGKGVVVGVIDTGLDLTHPDFSGDGGHTRVAWLLDLGASAPLGKYPELETEYGCSSPDQAPCAIWRGDDLDTALAASAAVPGDDVGHGTHVSSLAAGNGGPDATYVGMAPEATLVVVRVIRGASGDEITDTDILNAMRFVFDRAADLGLPAVVNLSLGGDFGPHDGTSPLEAGLASFVGPDHPGRAIVVAAGNSAGLLQSDSGIEYGTHTEARVLDGDPTRAILTTPDPVEKGVQGTVFVWVNYRAGDDVRVGLEMNGDVLLDPLAVGDQGALKAGNGHPYVAVLNGVVGDNSPLVAGSHGAIVNIDGSFSTTDKFALTFQGKGEVQMWVQGSGDAAYGSPVGGVLFQQGLKQGTINVPATHPSLIAVGCTLNRLRWHDASATEIVVQQVGSLVDPPGDSACYFSSAGPNALGVPKPELAAPGGFVIGAMSAAADPAKNPTSMFQPPSGRCPEGGNLCYKVDPHHAVASGTSMSAPHVTGAIALLFEEDPSLTQDQITAALQGGARRFQGIVPFDYQLGAGALDIEGAVAAVMERKTQGVAEPDVASSWVTMSAGYARPDPTWPVVGSVELRSTTCAAPFAGCPADGFDPRLLTLETDEAVVLEPLARMGPGVWRFAVAGADGSGGRVLRARVLYRGALIAEHTLPIGGDVWATRAVGEARGGCAIEGSSSPSRSGLLALIGALALARRRRSRAS